MLSENRIAEITDKLTALGIEIDDDAPFVLTLSDGTLVDVTRSYYNTFKEFFRI